MLPSLVSRALSGLVRRGRGRALLLVAGTCSLLLAQGTYRFKSYGPDQGLSNLATTCITQDATGYIWVGTEGGAFRYDGQRFLRFAQAEGIADTTVSDIKAFSDGTLLVMTTAVALRFDGRRFEPVRAGSGVQFQDRPRLTEAKDGSLLMGSFSGLARSTDGGRSFERVPNVPPGAITALWADPHNGEILAAQREGVPGDGRKPDYHLLRGSFRNGTLLWDRQELPAPFNNDRYDTILRDKWGHIWTQGSIYLLRLAAWGAAPVDMTAQLPGRPSQTLASLCLDQEKRVWAHTDNGLALFDGDRRILLGEAEGLPTPWANAIFVDREGSLWVGSEGVHRLQGGFLWQGFTRKQGLPSDAAWGLLRDRRNRLWAATLRGMARYEGQAFIPQPETADRRLYALAEDGEGAVWAGGVARLDQPSDLLRLAPGGQRFESVPVPSVGTATISSLAADPAGGLWIGSANKGLHRLLRKGGGWTCARVPLPGGADTENIARILIEPEGRVWAVGNHGIAVLESKGWVRITQDQGLKELSVYTLARDAGGRIWAGYWSVRGLSRLEHGASGWRVADHIDQPEATFDDDIVSLAASRDGALWFGTTEGVKRWKDGRFEQFTRSRGLPGEDCVGQSLWLDASGDGDGDVWAGTSSGIAHFDHRVYRGPLPSPKARITLVKDGGSNLREIGAQPIFVAYRFRSMDFAFECLSYLDETHLRPQVRLLGFEDGWRDSGSRSARYTTLPPGRYTFAARFLDADGQTGFEATQEIVILRPWWQSWWFLGLSALLLSGAVVFLVRWRTGLLHGRTLELERIVELRTRDLQTANEALEEASMVDALTGLKNRRYLGLHMPEEESRVQRAYRSAALRQELAKSEDLGLLVVDLDHFKFVNDTHGHAAGDAVLRQAAEVLRGACRESDTVARWGGEEFLIVARRVDRESVEAIARKVQDAFHNHPFELPDGGVIRRTCSIGFAVHPINPVDPAAFRWDETLEAADLCLYAAKNSGRDAWVGVFCDAGQGETLGAVRIIDLPDLVEEGRISLRSSVPADRLYWNA
ncbi:MAG: diguanylate cyclase [Holophagaceae bacterium]|nr:diguanylate cyclase [Holophagaceae bacterium]